MAYAEAGDAGGPRSHPTARQRAGRRKRGTAVTRGKEAAGSHRVTALIWGGPAQRPASGGAELRGGDVAAPQLGPSAGPGCPQQKQLASRAFSLLSKW